MVEKSFMTVEEVAAELRCQSQKPTRLCGN